MGTVSIEPPPPINPSESPMTTEAAYPKISIADVVVS
jgi:hypothetical protein